jgi:hypothetical protein
MIVRCHGLVVSGYEQRGRQCGGAGSMIPLLAGDAEKRPEELALFSPNNSMPETSSVRDLGKRAHHAANIAVAGFHALDGGPGHARASRQRFLVNAQEGAVAARRSDRGIPSTGMAAHRLMFVARVLFRPHRPSC